MLFYLHIYKTGTKVGKVYRITLPTIFYSVNVKFNSYGIKTQKLISHYYMCEFTITQMNIASLHAYFSFCYK